MGKTDKDKAVLQRLKWVKMYEETRDFGFVCRRCGISRPTLRKWWRRYESEGIEGLRDKSRRPLKSPNRKIFPEQEKWILDLRSSENLGARRIQNELMWRFNFKVSLATIHKVLKNHQVPNLRRACCRPKSVRRYEKAIPGERVQLDTMKLGKGLYQYTAVDDCSRFLVAGVYSGRTAANTVLFLDKVFDEMPFPIQRIQTDRGKEFFAHKVQKKLREEAIKFRPVKPRSPRLNGKVERVQQTMLREFYVNIELDNSELQTLLDEWVFRYNWFRGHGSLGGKAPIDRVVERLEKTPLCEEVGAMYDPEKESLRVADYLLDQKLLGLKRCR